MRVKDLVKSYGPLFQYDLEYWQLYFNGQYLGVWDRQSEQWLLGGYHSGNRRYWEYLWFQHEGRHPALDEWILAGLIGTP